mmetsp:Transcript_29125/g.44748  ORF Transcript_29125/g.44748 Transcript_29125/m.44748 type:complete len:97 (+) Transcript_29125:99-389(+)
MEYKALVVKQENADDILQSITEIESVRLHLSTLKKDEDRLLEEERKLHAEKSMHLHTLRRLANQDGSRFKENQKTATFCFCFLAEGAFRKFGKPTI